MVHGNRKAAKDDAMREEGVLCCSGSGGTPWTSLLCFCSSPIRQGDGFDINRTSWWVPAADRNHDQGTEHMDISPTCRSSTAAFPDRGHIRCHRTQGWSLRLLAEASRSGGLVLVISTRLDGLASGCVYGSDAAVLLHL